jgi:hypothetical protein
MTVYWKMDEKIRNWLTSSLVFILLYGVLTPVGMICRLFGRDPLRLSRKRGTGTYWISRRPPGPPPATMQNEF